MEPIRTRTLEVSVISGENLCVDRNPVTENTYVVVRSESIKCWSTKMAKQGVESSSTLWKEKLMVEMPLYAKSITLEVQCKTSNGMVRSIGLVRIAISEVIPKEDEVCSEVLSYRLRNWEGRRSGVINFSLKLKKEEEKDKEVMVSSGGAFGIGMDHHHETKSGANNGIVTGIPVCWIHPGIHV